MVIVNLFNKGYSRKLFILLAQRSPVSIVTYILMLAVVNVQDG